MDRLNYDLNYKLILEASPVALILLDTSGQIAYSNNCANSLFKYDNEELIGNNINILISEQYQIPHQDLLKKYTPNTSNFKFEVDHDLYVKKKNGEAFPAEMVINSIETEQGTFLIASIRDITLREKINEQFKLVVESAPNAMILINAQGSIVLINKQAEILFGYTRNELIGLKIEILLPENLKDQHINHRKAYNNHPTPREMGAGRDLFGIRKDGNVIPIEIGIKALERNENSYILASIIDITERKKNENAFKLYAKEIEQKNKELEQFTHIASHDLREPLNSITSIVELLTTDENYKIEDNVMKLLQYVNKSTYRMKELIIGLLDFAHLGKNCKTKLIDINTLISDVLSDLEATINQTEAKINVEPLPVISVYEIELRLLFQNLITNAIKYCSKDTIPEITISAEMKGNAWEFKVKDNGIGIPEDKLEDVFELFNRLHTRNEYEGIGIGLAHCRKIVELHNGEIWVKSELGKGCQFHFTISDKIKLHNA